MPVAAPAQGRPPRGVPAQSNPACAGTFRCAAHTTRGPWERVYASANFQVTVLSVSSTVARNMPNAASDIVRPSFNPLIIICPNPE